MRKAHSNKKENTINAIELVRDTANFVAKRSRQVNIEMARMEDVCINLSRMDIPKWSDWCHFFDGGEKTLDYFLVLDSINFCYWAFPGEQRWETETPSGGLSGYYGLALRLKQGIEEGIPITDADYLSQISEKQLKCILGGKGTLQLMPERAAILRETGRVLMESFKGKASNLVKAANKSAVRLVELPLEFFPSFRDTARFQGKNIFFLKRAQLLASDIHGAFSGKQWGEFHDIGLLTAFADYKLPQVLRELGVLTYDERLAEKVDSLKLLPPGSSEETEIRANTIIAVEVLKSGMSRIGLKVNSPQIDGLLWNLGQWDDYRRRPYHRTITIFY